MRVFLTQAMPPYAAFTVAALTQADWLWLTWTVVALAIGLILVSIFYYSPVILPRRKPGLVDWFEDKVYTGLLFVAVVLLLNDLLDVTLTP
jgi:hypothetical protein